MPLEDLLPKKNAIPLYKELVRAVNAGDLKKAYEIASEMKREKMIVLNDRAAMHTDAPSEVERHEKSSLQGIVTLAWEAKHYSEDDSRTNIKSMFLCLHSNIFWAGTDREYQPFFTNVSALLMCMEYMAALKPFFNEEHENHFTCALFTMTYLIGIRSSEKSYLSKEESQQLKERFLTKLQSLFPASDALKEAAAIFAENPKDSETLRLRASFYLQALEYKKLLADCRRVEALGIKNDYLKQYYPLALYKNGEFKEALKWYEEAALEADLPSSLQIDNLKQRIKCHCTLEDYAAALQIYPHLLTLIRTSNDLSAAERSATLNKLLSKKATLEHEMGAYKEAAATLALVSKLDPSTAMILANNQVKLGDMLSAHQTIERYAKIEEHMLLPLITLAIYTGEFAKAEKYIQKWRTLVEQPLATEEEEEEIGIRNLLKTFSKGLGKHIPLEEYEAIIASTSSAKHRVESPGEVEKGFLDMLQKERENSILPESTIHLGKQIFKEFGTIYNGERLVIKLDYMQKALFLQELKPLLDKAGIATQLVPSSTASLGFAVRVLSIQNSHDQSLWNQEKITSLQHEIHTVITRQLFASVPTASSSCEPSLKKEQQEEVRVIVRPKKLEEPVSFSKSERRRWIELAREESSTNTSPGQKEEEENLVKAAEKPSLSEEEIARRAKIPVSELVPLKKESKEENKPRKTTKVSSGKKEVSSKPVKQKPMKLSLGEFTAQFTAMEALKKKSKLNPLAEEFVSGLKQEGKATPATQPASLARF